MSNLQNLPSTGYSRSHTLHIKHKQKKEINSPKNQTMSKRRYVHSQTKLLGVCKIKFNRIKEHSKMRLTETDIVTILWEYNIVLEKKLLACYFNSIHCLCTFVLCHKWQNKRLRTIHDWFKSKHLCQHPLRPTLFSWLTRLREKKQSKIYSVLREV